VTQEGGRQRGEVKPFQGSEGGSEVRIFGFYNNNKKTNKQRAEGTVARTRRENGATRAKASDPTGVNKVVVGPFQEEDEVTGMASDVVTVVDEDLRLATTGCRGEDRVRRYVGDYNSWVRSPLARGNPGTVTIPQY